MTPERKKKLRVMLQCTVQQHIEAGVNSENSWDALQIFKGAEFKTGSPRKGGLKIPSMPMHSEWPDGNPLLTLKL